MPFGVRTPLPALIYTEQELVEDRTECVKRITAAFFTYCSLAYGIDTALWTWAFRDGLVRVHCTYKGGPKLDPVARDWARYRARHLQALDDKQYLSLVSSRGFSGMSNDQFAQAFQASIHGPKKT